MPLRLEKRAERSSAMALASPLIAIALTLIFGAAVFASRGVEPLHGLYVYFVEPLSDEWSLEKLIVKATPLVMMAAGLALAYRANVWNIGAAGQLQIGALFAGLIPVYFSGWQDPSVMPAMLVMGVVGGLFWALIPAYLKVRFNANEILTSLMMVYIADLVFDWLVRGPMRDPQGHNFPKTVNFVGWQTLPHWGDIHFGALIALVAALALGFMAYRMLKGFELLTLGAAPRAGRFAGFSAQRAVYFCFALSGGLAGLAGACDVMGVGNQLQTPYSTPAYGFVAIIVAFLGRLNPIGAIFAGLLLALTFVGGEAAQTALHIPDKIAKVFQGVLLFFVLACDTLVYYRVKWESRK
ncbi:MAG: ABC transporter permease [Pseudomonadota bacterium]|nr:ABC transporter permease [Pseudomonadota bacterium]